jgi:hypothetical protein
MTFVWIFWLVCFLFASLFISARAIYSYLAAITITGGRAANLHP